MSIQKIKNILSQDIGRFKLPETDETNLVANDILDSLRKEINRAVYFRNLKDTLMIFYIDKIELKNKIKKTINEEHILINEKLKPIIDKINYTFINYMNDNYKALKNESKSEWDEEGDQVLLGLYSHQKIDLVKLEEILKDNPFKLVEALIYEYFKVNLLLEEMKSDYDWAKKQSRVYASEEILENIIYNIGIYIDFIFTKPDFKNQSENQINGIYNKNNEHFKNYSSKIHLMLFGNVREELSRGRVSSSFFENTMQEAEKKLEPLFNNYFSKKQEIDTSNFKNLFKTKFVEKNGKWEISIDKTRLFYYTNMNSLHYRKILTNLEQHILKDKKLFENDSFSIKANNKLTENEFIELKINKKLEDHKQELIKDELVNNLSLLIKRFYQKSYLTDVKMKINLEDFLSEFSKLIREQDLLIKTSEKTVESRVRKKL